MPSGTLSAKIHGHGKNERMIPPMVGPPAVPTATKIEFTATERPSSSLGNSARLSAFVVTSSAEPPRPWTMRIATRNPKLGAKAAPIVASVNTPRPVR